MVTLYDFITSDQFEQHLERIDSLAQKVLDLDVKEKKAHDLTWDQRGGLMRQIQRAQGEIVAAIDRITVHSEATVAATG